MSLRILHTADWHLGARLGGLDRLRDQVARLEELMGHAEERRADVLLVCGDVLEESRPQRLAPIVAEVARLLRPSIERGMQCVLLEGNHDSQHTFELLASLQRLLAGEAGQVHFVGSPTLLALDGADGKPAASLLALPYPKATAYAVDPQMATLEHKATALRQAVGREIERLAALADCELPGVPRIAAGHFMLGGAPADNGHEVSESEEIRIDGSHLEGFAYVALGHVHEPTRLNARMRYSGPLDRMDFGETGQDRHAVLVEVDADGNTVQIELPLDPTPMAEIEIGSLADIAEQAEALGDPDRTIVKLVLRLGRDDSASLWLSEARERFARLRQPPEIIKLDDPLPSLVTGEIERGDTGQTVRDYLASELEDDPDRDELLALAAELLAGHAEERA